MRALEFTLLADLPGYTLTSRTQGFAASVKVTENGADSELLVILFNMNGDPIPAGEGPILQLLFNIDASATPEDVSVLKFTEAVVAANSGTEIPV